MDDPQQRASDGTVWHAAMPKYLVPTSDPPLEMEGACGNVFVRVGDAVGSWQEVTCASCRTALGMG